MNLSDLNKKGAFVDGALIAKTGEWKHIDPETGAFVADQVQFFVRQASYVDYRKALDRIPQDGITPDQGLDPEALVISACIRLGDGTEQIPYEQAAKLESGLFKVFRDAIAEIYSPEAADPKRLPPKTNSGASSSSRASAVKPLRKPKKTSATRKR